jgi:gliding motility-associated protein GldM
MSLPKEPRQKMINMMYLVLTALLALNVSAEILNAFKTVTNSLEKSNGALQDEVKNTMDNFNAAINDPTKRENAVKFKPNADKVIALTKELSDYLDAAKKEVKDAAGDKGDGQFKEDDQDAATRIFVEQSKGDELKSKIEKYVAEIKALGAGDANELKALERMITVDANAPKTEDNKDFKNAYFNMVPAVAALTILSKFQNDIKTTETQLVNHYFSKVSAVKLIYDKFEAFVGTNATYFMPGQQMEINAGVGSFSSAAKPQISVNGSPVATDENGVANYKFNVSNSGTVNVKVVYTKPDGSQGVVEKALPYTVGQPSGASVFLDKMNVFYIGVDNPITIGSSAGMEKTTVTGSNCSISGSGTKRIVRVSSEGESSVTVTADGKPNVFRFRNYRLPTPPATLGRISPGPASTADVASQGGLFAVLDDFIFDAQYRVTSFCMAISKKGADPVLGLCSSSNALTGQQSTALRTAGPGSTVSFYNIKVVGPDGQTRDAKAISYICK